MSPPPERLRRSPPGGRPQRPGKAGSAAAACVNPDTAMTSELDFESAVLGGGLPLEVEQALAAAGLQRSADPPLAMALLMWLGTMGFVFFEGEGLLFFSLGVWMQKAGFNIEELN
mgnify:CR=1 FL=1